MSVDSLDVSLNVEDYDTSYVSISKEHELL